jgi:hypothetical protein
MAHFAKLDENNNVLSVHVLDNKVITINNVESEQTGISFLSQLHNHSLWKQTSYNGSFRKQYCGVGYFYNEELDIFIAPQPYESWSLDTNFDWQPPVPMPTEGRWQWNENTTSWMEVENGNS